MILTQILRDGIPRILGAVISAMVSIRKSELDVCDVFKPVSKSNIYRLNGPLWRP